MRRREWLASLPWLAAGCGASRRARLQTPGRLVEPAPDRYRAEFRTTQGTYVIAVERALAPNGADRFFHLARNGFYDGASFFRVLPKFVVQWGLPADPRLAEVWHHARIADDPVRGSNTRGTICFAMGGPASRTTQVYVNMADNTRLDRLGFAPFGRVESGLEVFAKLHSGYGEGPPRGKGPSQERIRKEGAAYLRKEFPLLDSVLRVRVLPARRG
jgi:peptidyl-prolyl cis-trans isomerase A (cyclophilin A)